MYRTTVIEPPKDHRIFGQLLFGHEKEHTFLSNSDLITEHVTGWKYNRPPDEPRVTEILEDIEKENAVDGILYIAEIIDDDKSIKYVCYDGNHRRESLSRSNNSFRVLTQVMWNAKHEEIKERFIKLNKANPVPDLYLANDDKEYQDSKKLLIHEVVTKIVNKWPKFQSTSKAPRKPNFNRDKLIDQLSTLNFENMNVDDVFNRLIELNNNYSKTNFKKINEKIINKSRNGKCFLFLKDFTEDFE